VRRVAVGAIAFLALTGTFQVLPVYAAPSPAAHPVEPSIDELSLGSVTDPAEDAVVVADGEAQPGGVDTAEASAAPEAPATAVPTEPSAVPTEPSAGPTEPSAGPTESSAAPTEPSVTSAVPRSTPADPDVVSSGRELAGVPALTLSEPETDEFSTVGVTWRQDDVFDVVVRIRVADEEGDWGSWTTLSADDIEQTPSGDTDATEVRGGTAPYWTGPASGIEVIVQAQGVVPNDVRVTLIDPGTSKADTLPMNQGPTGQAHAGVNEPSIVGRAQWGADESIRGWDPQYAPTIKAATLHHTDDRNTYAAADVPGMMRAIYAYHTLTRGWGDIGYNFIVDKFGRIFEGRYGGVSSTVVGAHAGGFNTGTVGVSMLGNYTTTEPSDAMLAAVADVIAWKLSLYKVDPRGTTQLTSGGGGTSKYAAGAAVTLPTVFAHRDVGSTTCPGQAAYNHMAQLRDMVSARYTGIGGSPTGNLEQLSVRGGSIHLEGWTYDPDQPATPINVGVSVDGAWSLSIPADQDRPDVGAAFPQAGSRHGFRGQFPVAPGTHNVCVVFVNVAPYGGNAWASCQSLTVQRADANTPIGNVDEIRTDGRQLSVRGWAMDPDALASALRVDVYVNGALAQAVTADAQRPDIAAAFPAAGPAHGWSWATTVTQPGSYRICLYAVNLNRGIGDTLLTCTVSTVSAALFQPLGHVDVGQLKGRTFTFDGWAMDPDDPAAPVMVAFFLDGRLEWAVWSGGSRPDIANAFPGAGDQHGFALSRQVSPGAHTACAYAVNIGAGNANSPLGCASGTVTVQPWEPVGHLDGATAIGGGRVTVQGWVWDPDAGSSSSPVSLYVDGQLTAAFATADDRPDLAAALPAEAGTAHGFSPTLSLGAGRHSICAFGRNVGIGSANPFLGCVDVTA
jgi:hypothetical protein